MRNKMKKKFVVKYNDVYIDEDIKEFMEKMKH